MNREFDFILRSCSSLALFCSRSCKHMVLSISLVTAWAMLGLFVELETKVYPKIRNHGEGPY